MNNSSKCKIEITNATIGSPYSLYLDSDPRRYTQGNFQSSNLTIEVPANLAKAGRLQTTIKRTTRLDTDLPVVVEFSLRDHVQINLGEKYKEVFEGQHLENAPKKPEAALLENQEKNAKNAELKKKTKTQKGAETENKKLVSDEDKVLAKKNDSSQKRSFWDRFK